MIFFQVQSQGLAFISGITGSRVPTSSGNHGKPGKLQTKVPYMKKSWNLKKLE